MQRSLKCMLLLAWLLVAACQNRLQTPLLDDLSTAGGGPGGDAASARPSWFFNQNIGGRLGGVGVSGRHIQGLNAQRELAVSRAIDELARQMAVKVASFTTVQGEGGRDNMQTTMEVYSIQTVSGQTVRATIEEFWHDPKTDELFVWMVVEQ